MRLSSSAPFSTTAALLASITLSSWQESFAFCPQTSYPRSSTSTKSTTSTTLFGYLDDLSSDLNAPDGSGEVLDREAMNLDKEQVDPFGVGSWDDFVEFNEFDGGDGQMGVAGDGKKGLDAEWKGQAEIAKSRSMSAKNAWGSSTGYADELRSKGVETSRAQQLENWANQQELQRMRNQQKFMTEQFDQVAADENWRNLASFGVERNQDFDLDETFGQVTVGDRLDGTIELNARINQAQISEFDIVNSFMGFSDFRARFTPETNPGDWSVEPNEGSLSGKKATPFVVKFRPQNPGVSEGYLVIETEDDKWTFKLTGSTSM